MEVKTRTANSSVRTVESKMDIIHVPWRPLTQGPRSSLQSRSLGWETKIDDRATRAMDSSARATPSTTLNDFFIFEVCVMSGSIWTRSLPRLEMELGLHFEMRTPSGEAPALGLRLERCRHNLYEMPFSFSIVLFLLLWLGLAEWRPCRCPDCSVGGLLAALRSRRCTQNIRFMETG
ncbi:unnamed protein product [Nesidiocoris tenuis]|uniref:Uncharacterized protein n=1 Tax=Nesidiocoris tenuis TaxID=355587 RepID=A0A6H5HFY9_9HEMI|nr:unnamed protein product [Nesidiocoris tenuis]